MSTRTRVDRAVEIPPSASWDFPKLCVRCMGPATAHVALTISAHREYGTLWGIQKAGWRTGPLPRVPYCAAHRNAIVGPERVASRNWGIIAAVGLLFSIVTLVGALAGGAEGENLGDHLGGAIFAAMVAGVVTGGITMGACWVAERVRHPREWMADYHRAMKGDQAEGTYHPGVDATLVIDDDAPTPMVTAIRLQFENPDYARRFAGRNGLPVVP